MLVVSETGHLIDVPETKDLRSRIDKYDAAVAKVEQILSLQQEFSIPIKEEGLDFVKMLIKDSAASGSTIQSNIIKIEKKLRLDSLSLEEVRPYFDKSREELYLLLEKLKKRL